jgi:hypothetical protein
MRTSFPLSEIFSQGKVAVALEENRVAGIVTKIDLIDYLAGPVHHRFEERGVL